MSMWHEARRTMPDRERFRVWVAGKLHDVHHETAGQDAPPFADRPEVVRKTWLARADRLIANL